MKGGKAMRVALDVALTVMIVLEMFIQLTGEFLHEVIGFAFFATVIAHIALSAGWVKKTARNAKAGKLTARRTALAVVGILLAVTTVVLGVSSIAISGILASAGFVWPIGSYAVWANVHTFSAYALCALVVVHLAMHWAFLASAFKVPYDPARRRAIATGVNTVAALGVAALGVTVVGKMASQVADASTGQGAQDSSESAPSSGGSRSGSSSGRSRSGSASGGSPSGSASSGGGTASSGGGTASSGSGTASSGGGSTASGICTLCRKQCPLSAPKCDKPYREGLL